MEDVIVDNIVACTIQDYYELLGSIGHLNPNEGKSIFIVLMMTDYIDNYNQILADKELECLEKIRMKAIQDSCILSRKVLC